MGLGLSNLPKISGIFKKIFKTMSRRSWQDYFSFSKKELNGLLILLLLMLIVIVSPMFYQPSIISPKIDIAAFKEEAAAFEQSLQQERVYSYRDTHAVKKKQAAIAYFNFDPNDLPAAKWLKLGLSEKQISVIKNYEAKGGKFYSKADVQKMYVITKTQFSALEPYIQIDARRFAKGGIAKKVLVKIDINLADSSDLEQVRGIGPAFAARIVKYRDRLGGFYSLTQLKEVYGVDSANFASWSPQLILENPPLRKININEAAFEDLKRHPYLNFKQINAILQYRKQHGAYADMQDLRKVGILSDEILRKIAPYLSFQ